MSNVAIIRIEQRSKFCCLVYSYGPWEVRVVRVKRCTDQWFCCYYVLPNTLQWYQGMQGRGELTYLVIGTVVTQTFDHHSRTTKQYPQMTCQPSPTMIIRMQNNATWDWWFWTCPDGDIGRHHFKELKSQGSQTTFDEYIGFRVQEHQKSPKNKGTEY